VRALVHLVPRAGAGSAFPARFAELLAELRDRAAKHGVAVNALHRLERDAFGRRTPFRAAFELEGDGAGERAEELLAGLGARIDDVAQPDLSSLVVGEDVVFMAPPRTPVRYQYLMRRNASYTHATYLERYANLHSRFGLVTPGHLGYVQLHVEPDVSRRVAARAAIGGWACDSISELYLESQDAFLAALSSSGFGREAIADEEHFVDRASSIDLCSTVEWDPTLG
jgi:EthD domain-containing protein